MKCTELSFVPALYVLSAQYAIAADRRDGDAFASVFEPDGLLRGFVQEELRARVQGHDELRRVPASLRRYARTMHFVGTVGYVVDGDEATGEVYCVAHHVSREPVTDLIMHIRYEDRYRKASDGRWLFSQRDCISDCWPED
jgi:hypothetical protein